MSRETADRIAAGMAAAWRNRVGHLPGHLLRSDDGVLACISNLPDEKLNVALVEQTPEDALGALSRAEWLFKAHGHAFGVEVERGRHPGVDRAVRALGLTIGLERPAMAIRMAELALAAAPAGVEVRQVATPEDLRAMVDLEVGVFDTNREVAERLCGPTMLSVPGARLYVARRDGEPVALCWTSLHEAAVGVFGVGTMPAHRRLGVGAALTSFAAHDAPGGDLAWLQPTTMGRALYDSMAFVPVDDWQVWVRPAKVLDRHGI
ncbi:MAG: GNAT family N-acetyltransferase [Actinomycetota bacterium]